MHSGGAAPPGGAYLVISGWDLVEKVYLPTGGPGSPPEPGNPQLRNSPEPFNPETDFSFDLPDDGLVSLRIYDLTGRLVATLLDRRLEAGTYSQAWNAAGLPSGIYVARLATRAGMVTERCLLLK